MKLIFEKTKKRACPAKLVIKRSGGFALLFSVLVSSLLLTIGLSIFSIALKELAISTATRESIHAFYAADSGREYARYRDLRLGNFPNISSLILSSPDINVSSSTEMSIESGSDGPNFRVVVRKERSAASSTTDKVNTIITSSGYNSKGGERLERAISQTY